MRLPLLPTAMVAVMVPTMIALGFWQLQRAEWKQGVLADLAEAPSLPPVDLDAPPQTGINFRRASATCIIPAGKARPATGKNTEGRNGYSYTVSCRGGVDAVVGWAPRPDVVIPETPLGRVSGTVIEAADGTRRLYAETPLVPLVPAAAPTLDTISDNHLAYAVQWFGFAATLGIIYAVYLRRWQRQRVAVDAGSR